MWRAGNETLRDPNPGEAVATTARLVWVLGCTGKLVWSIPVNGFLATG